MTKQINPGYENIDKYMNEIKKIPLLTQEELNQLLNQYRLGNQEAKKQILERNLKLVVSVATFYARKTEFLTLLDLIQEGNIGLIKAIETYDEAKGSFSTYAILWIKQRIFRTLDNQERLIRRPVDFLQLGRKYKAICEKYYKENNRMPEDDYIIEKLEITKEKLKSLKDDHNLNNISLNQRFNLDAEQSEEIGEIVPNNIDDYENLENDMEMFDYLNVIKSVLSPRQYYIIYHRVLMENKYKQEILSEKFNVSRQRVSELEQKTLSKIKPYAIKTNHLYEKTLNNLKTIHNDMYYRLKTTPIDPTSACIYLYLFENLTEIEQKILYTKVLSIYEFNLNDLEQMLSINKKQIIQIYNNLKIKIEEAVKTTEFKDYSLKILKDYDENVNKMINQLGFSYFTDISKNKNNK